MGNDVESPLSTPRHRIHSRAGRR